MLPYSSSIAAPPLLVVVDLDRNVVAVVVDLFVLCDTNDVAAIVAAVVGSGEMRCCCCCLERIGGGGVFDSDDESAFIDV
jgi:hypothetical protein